MESLFFECKDYMKLFIHSFNKYGDCTTKLTLYINSWKKNITNSRNLESYINAYANKNFYNGQNLPVYLTALCIVGYRNRSWAFNSFLFSIWILYFLFK